MMNRREVMRKQLKRPEKVANGFLPANSSPYNGAYILFRPGLGIVRVGFGNGMNGPDEEDQYPDCNGNIVDDYVYIQCYGGNPEDGSWLRSVVQLPGHSQKQESIDGLLFMEEDGFNMLFSRKSYQSGDLRDLLKKALKCINWPIDVEHRYFLLGTEGEMNWNGKPTIK
jgi:hypothetical protein